MKTLHYEIKIHAPVEKVYQTMISKETYKVWTEAFSPGSDFRGSWEKDSKIYFTAPDENGELHGMVAVIAENVPNEFISIRHMGILDNNGEITSGKEIEEWAGALENYSFSEENGITTLTIAVDTTDDHITYFNEAWVKALQILKTLCEKPSSKL
ncbi:MAG TPA: SRPBCC domain-containing protein [Sphingobacterium sp.]|nr:SRPBCC domain-containing protein [Sphingobacterium sp.]